MKNQNYSLILKAFVGFCVFNVILGITSFMWIEGYLINTLLMIVITIIPFVSIAIKRNYNSNLFKNAMAIFLAFWMCFFFQYIVKDQIVKSSEAKGEILASRVEAYKELNNKYPLNLNLEEFSDLDLSSFLNSKIQYESRADSTYRINFSSFNQSIRIYNGVDAWYSDD